MFDCALLVFSLGQLVAAASSFCFGFLLRKEYVSAPETKKRRELQVHAFVLAAAEREGFEPPEPLSSTVFKTAAIDHSAISPAAKVRTVFVFCKLWMTNCVGVSGGRAKYGVR